MLNESLFSSKKNDWGTPPELFKFLDEIFHFTLDACADIDNALCNEFLDKKDDFMQLLTPNANLSIWMNPPYQDAEKPCKPTCKKKKCLVRGHHVEKYIPGIGDFVDHLQSVCVNGTTGVALLPSRTETKWFQTCWEAEALIFIRGRLKFVGAESSAPFPSVLAVFGRGLSSAEKQKLETIGKVIIQ